MIPARATVVRIPALLALLMVTAVSFCTAQARDRQPYRLSPAKVSALVQQLRSSTPSLRVEAARALAKAKPVPAEAIPALIEVVKDSSASPILRNHAVQALANAGSLAIPALTQLLDDKKNRAARLAAVRALGDMAKREPAAWPLLIGAFKDGAVRGWASAELSTVGAPVVPLLRQSLKDPESSIRLGSAAALGMSGEAAREAVPDLITALDDRDPQVRERVVLALGSLAKYEPAVWPVLIRTFKDRALQPRAAKKLGEVGAPVVPLLRQALTDPDREMRRGALQALQMNEGVAKDAVPELVISLMDRDANMRALAAADLRRIGPSARDAAPALSSLLNDPDRIVRDQAALALAIIDPNARQAVPILSEAVKFKRSTVHYAAVEALGEMGANARDAIPTLEQVLLTDEEVRYRVAITKVLGPIAGTDALPALTRALTSDEEADVRRAALGAIEKLGLDQRTTASAIVQALGDDDGYVRTDAAEALGKLGEAAVPELIAALQSPDLYIRRSAVQLLGRVKPPRDDVLRALTGALKDRGRPVRLEAARALQQAGVEAGRAALVRFEQEDENGAHGPRDEKQKLYTREEIAAPIPPDDDHKYPSPLAHLLSFPADAGYDAQVLVTVHRGQDRPDRLAFWRKVGRDKYQAMKIIYAGGLERYSFGAPTVFRSKVLTERHVWRLVRPSPRRPTVVGSKVLTKRGSETSETVGQFFHVSTHGWRSVGHAVFALEFRDGYEVHPVKIESPVDWYTKQRRPGETVTSNAASTFSDNKLEFQFDVRSQHGSPRTRRVTGTYKIVKEITPTPAFGAAYGIPGQVFITPKTVTQTGRCDEDEVVTWKMVVESAR